MITIQCCASCKYYYKEHCVNGKSEKCTEDVAVDYYCEDFEDAKDN